jgi:ABC-type Na+ efflux pump permease subunit
MLGKIVPYILVGYIQVTVILLGGALHLRRADGRQPAGAARLHLVLFIAPTCRWASPSTVARNQLQAMQMTFFFFLPSMLLSGFMFPFRACPAGRRPSASAAADALSWCCASCAASCSRRNGVPCILRRAISRRFVPI